jgi:F0F1-type ATP synthase assembly protein I
MKYARLFVTIVLYLVATLLRVIAWTAPAVAFLLGSFSAPLCTAFFIVCRRALRRY